MRRRLISLLVAGLLVAGLASPAAASGGSYSVLTAMTYNLYVGTDLFELLNPVPECGDDATCSLIVQAGAALDDVEQTDFEERAKTIARLIANRRVDVVGLQEVSTITTIPTDPSGRPAGAPVVTNYLDILLKALEAQGAHYEVAALVDNASVGPIPAGRLTADGLTVENLAFLDDRDVILTRHGVHFDGAKGAAYQSAQLEIPIGGQAVEFTRSWVAVDITVDERTYTAVNTHLEVEFETLPDGNPNPANQIQTAQAAELMTIVEGIDDVVLLGDFNSGPDSETGFPTPYEVISASGLADSWNEQVFSHRPGYTCCQAELLDNATSELDQRIDQIWLGKDVEPRWIFANTVGDRRWQKTPSGLWPSDHAGVVMYAVFR